MDYAAKKNDNFPEKEKLANTLTERKKAEHLKTLELRLIYKMESNLHSFDLKSDKFYLNKHIEKVSEEKNKNPKDSLLNRSLYQIKTSTKKMFVNKALLEKTSHS